ncbi:MAG TPA: hypothetical protein VF490_15065 [Chryseosolibacter sp.]
MKKLVHRILVLSALTILFAVGAASAQDAGMSDKGVAADEHESTDADKAVFSPGESEVKYIPKAPAVRTAADSVTARAVVPAAQKISPKTVQKDEKPPKDDSILTFNFLYYIIQKYKLQDIID